MIQEKLALARGDVNSLLYIRVVKGELKAPLRSLQNLISVDL